MSEALSIAHYFIRVPQALFPSLLSLTMAKVPCTCGCGRNISRSTKLNHLKGHGTTALRARVLAETKSLKIIADQRQESQNRGSKKRSSSNLDQGSSHKRLKASQPTASPDPEIFEVPMDPFEPTLEPEVLSTAEPLPTKSNLAVERTWHAMEQHWGAWRNNSHNNDGNGDEDGDNEDEDEDEDEDSEDENDILGLSTWDLLGADFECEAAALGLS